LREQGGDHEKNNMCVIVNKHARSRTNWTDLIPQRSIGIAACKRKKGVQRPSDSLLSLHGAQLSRLAHLYL